MKFITISHSRQIHAKVDLMIIIPMGLLALANPIGQIPRLTFLFALVVNASLLLLFHDSIIVRLMVIVVSTFSMCLTYFSLRKLKCSIFLTWKEICLLIVMRLAHLYSRQLVTAVFYPYNDGNRLIGARNLMCVELDFFPKIIQACLCAIGHIFVYLRLYSNFLSTMNNFWKKVTPLILLYFYLVHVSLLSINNINSMINV